MSVADDRIMGVAEQKRNTPDSSQSNYDIDDPADNSGLSAADKADQIKLENTYAAPVKAADNQKRQRYFI